MGQNIPMVSGARGYAGEIGSPPYPSLRNGIRDLPKIRGDLGLFPVAGIVMPMVPATDLDAGIELTVEGFQTVKGGTRIFIFWGGATFRGGPFCLSFCDRRHKGVFSL